MGTARSSVHEDARVNVANAIGDHGVGQREEWRRGEQRHGETGGDRKNAASRAQREGGASAVTRYTANVPSQWPPS